MKLRRSLALAAATAAIAPAVLLAAPAAYATDDPTPTAGETTVTEEEPTPAQDDTAPATDDATPTEGATPTEEETAPETSEPATPTASASPSASPSASVSASASATATAAPGPVECEVDEDLQVDEDLHTGLSGLPSKIVAGSGFHGFKLDVKNTGSHSYQRVDLGVFAAQVDEDDFFIDTGYLTLQYKDPATGQWTDISLDESDEGAGYLGYTDIKAKESFSIGLRLAVDKNAPSGLGFAISIGMYADDEGNCVYSGDASYYEFDILAAGTEPGDVDDSEPQGGSDPLPNKPSGNTPIDPQGNLADTGAGSMLPVIALAGGAAVAVGTGAVFLVRRRKTGSTGVAA
ncbi:LPXTG cell wall anchor domain-containing protein [Streptomyces sp. GQFP]|uniref:LPXTG cell wall anchor domain-containing protein n=1 Tax=Streptomyces sp. GQFP TaxID=2907545 RepID=UPI001F1DB026|nr:LPXTG cell wall anchor domain-containing protein [Streptomyces sp. GQFP]UIX34130.1 LPXTG cell wall anchor domain-containing protein [Streptomyces sp. GQFP]